MEFKHKQHTHKHTHKHPHTHRHAYSHMYTYTHTHIHTHIFTHAHTHTRTHTHTNTYTHTYTSEGGQREEISEYREKHNGTPRTKKQHLIEYCSIVITPFSSSYLTARHLPRRTSKLSGSFPIGRGELENAGKITKRTCKNGRCERQWWMRS